MVAVDLAAVAIGRADLCIDRLVRAPGLHGRGADLFLIGAAESITRQVLDDEPTGLDVAVTATGRLTPSSVAGIDAALREQIDRIGPLGTPVRNVYADLSLQTPSADGVSPPQTIVGSGARLVARDGAIDALDIVEGDRSVDGIWISARLSDRLDLRPGSLVAVAGSDPVPIAGVFADLWDGERDPYWDDVPPALVPTYSSVFNGPLYEVAFVSEPVFLGFGVDRIVRWDSGIVARPESYAELVDLARRTRGLEQSSGSMTALVGSSGSGKTTLLNLIVGGDEPDQGTITGLRSRPDWVELTIVPQTLGLLPELTIGENVGLPLRLGAVGARTIDDVVELLGIAPLVDRPPEETSLGEQQRAAVARALVTAPALLVADEPTSHQDEANTHRVTDALAEMAAGGSCVFLATHDPRMLDRCDRVLHIRDGVVTVGE